MQFLIIEDEDDGDGDGDGSGEEDDGMDGRQLNIRMQSIIIIII